MTSKLLRYGCMAVGVGALLVGFQNFSGGAKKVQREGTLEVLHEDYPDKSSRTRHYLSENSGQRYELKFKTRAAQNLLSGSKIRVNGSESGNILYLAEADSTNILQLSTATNWAAGEQKTVVLLVNFQDNVSQPVTSAFVQNLMFTTINDFFLENSFQQTWLSGNVYGWYTIPMSSTSCDGNAIRTYAKNAATAAGVDLSGYSRFVYMFPRISACGWGGAASVGGSDTWINGYFDLRTVGHELGHNLGLNHSHSLSCDLSPISSSCIEYDYGDLVDIMGNYKAGHFNAYQKEKLGWLNASGMPAITTVQTSGSYVLEPYASPSLGGAKALKILKGFNSTTGEATWYYLEFRQPVGFDSTLVGVGNQLGGVEVRGVIPAQDTNFLRQEAFQLDMTPNSNPLSDTNDMLDGAMAVGQSFTDTSAGVTFSVASVSSSGAVVNVSFGQPSSACVRANPVIAISPANQSVAIGTTVNYTVTVTNKDTSACGASTFNLGMAGTSSFYKTSFSNGFFINVSPGTSESTTLTIQPYTNTSGIYNFNVIATTSLSTPYSSMASASVNFGGTTCTRSLPIVSISPSAGPSASAGTPVVYTLSVTNSDSTACGSSLFNFSSILPSGWSGGFANSSLSLSPSAVGSVTLTAMSAASATAGVYNLSAAVTNSSAATYSRSVAATYTVASVASCLRVSPSMTLSPLSQSAYAGQTLNYTLTLTNKDSSACGASTFNLGKILPGGLSASFSSTSLNLNPGSSASATVAVTSSTALSSGTYNFNVTAVNSSGTTSASNISAGYTVLPSMTATVSTDKSVYNQGSSVYLTASVSSIGTPAAGVSVSFAITKPDGSVVNASAVTDTSGRAVYKLRLSRKAVVGSYQVKINAASGGQSASAVNSFSVQ